MPRPRGDALVYESGWQSWSPSGIYLVGQSPPRPKSKRVAMMSFRPGRPPLVDWFQGEGLLGWELPESGECRLWYSANPHLAMPSIRLRVTSAEVQVEADGDIESTTFQGAIPQALDRHFAEVGRRLQGTVPAPGIPAVWCSWGFHRGTVTSADALCALRSSQLLDLPIEVIQVDDGWQREIGDWDTARSGFGDLPELARLLTAAGLRMGLWLAPFLVGARSQTAARHPEWLVDGPRHPNCWHQPMRVLDITHPEAARHLQATIQRLVELGCSYFKLDFLYAGAWPGARRDTADPLVAYRRGMGIIREAAGARATLVGSGAPLLPSIGLVDAMRVSPDIALHELPRGGDLSQPSLWSALHTGRARSGMHQRLWINDPDMLIVRRRMPNRDLWAEHVTRMGGLVASGDRLADLDQHGLHLLRTALQSRRQAPAQWLPDRGGLQGSLG